MRIRTDSNYDGGNVTHEAMRMNIVKPDVLIPKIKMVLKYLWENYIL